MDPEKKLKNLIRESNQKIALQSQEKSAIRANVLAFMKAHPPMLRTKAVFASWLAPVWQKPVLRYASALSLVALVFIGGTISYAAQYALPGQALYPVKTKVNEKVLSFIAFSDEQRAEYDINLAQTRLEEMEMVVVADGENDARTAQVKKLLDGHIASATARAERISHKKQPEVAAKIQSEIEASLQGHEKVLDALVLNYGEQSKRKQAVNAFVSDLKTTAKEATRVREKGEKELSGDDFAVTSGKAKVPAQKRLEAAKKATVEFAEHIADKKSSVSVDAQAQALIVIENANELIFQGEAKMGLNDFAGAFADFQQAIRIVQEARIHMNASAQFKIAVPAQHSIENDIND